ncbi:MAG: LCP family protein, partial [Oscillospiraceae bacterium]|nr:LCP family protein [Oscillospiraceae bacterium]
TLETAEYDSLTDLADALLVSEEVDAIVLNIAYLDVLEEIEGYEDIADRIVQVTYHAVETVVETNNSTTSDSVFTVFISGIDSRSSTLSSKSRSDVNILAVVNTETRQVLLVSTPRDYYVPLSISNGRKDKLTHAGIYGISVCMDTISMLYDVDVDYYFRLNFAGFVDIIDALGGITVVSDYTFTTQNVGGYSFVAGENEVDGAAALAFCRERYAFSSGDRQRGKNQMAVIEGVINKLVSSDLLLNYASVLSALEDSFETSVPYSLISQIVKDQLADNSAWNIVSYSVDGSGDYQIPYSMSQYAYVMVPDESTVATAQELIQAVLNGETISDPEE